MSQPCRAFNNAGACTYILPPAGKQVQGWNYYDKTDYFQVELSPTPFKKRSLFLLFKKPNFKQ